MLRYRLQDYGSGDVKIALITSIFERPGLGTYVHSLAQGLAAREHNVVVITRGRMSGFERTTLDGFRLIKAPYAPIPPVHLLLHKPFLDHALSLEGPFDIVNVHTPLCPVPVVGAPIVTMVHSPLSSNILHEDRNDLRSKAGRFYVRLVSARAEEKLLKASTAILATSSGVARDLGEYGINPERVQVVGNGVDPVKFHPPPMSSLRSQDILYTGRLGTGKGLDYLLSAFATVRNLNPKPMLRIFGDGPLRKHLERRAHQLGVANRVRFEGFVDSRHLAEVYRTCSCFVSPSLYEGLSTSLLEAMASAAPIVATRVPGSEDAIENGVSGLLVPPGNSERLAEAISVILSNRETALHMGMEARRTVEQKFTWDTITGLFDRAFYNLTE